MFAFRVPKFCTISFYVLNAKLRTWFSFFDLFLMKVIKFNPKFNTFFGILDLGSTKMLEGKIFQNVYDEQKVQECLNTGI